MAIKSVIKGLAVNRTLRGGVVGHWLRGEKNTELVRRFHPGSDFQLRVDDQNLIRDSQLCRLWRKGGADSPIDQ
jgi:hypothetical protein